MQGKVKGLIVLCFFIFIGVEMLLLLNLKSEKITGLMDVYIFGCLKTGGFRYCQPDLIYVIIIDEKFENGETFDYLEFLKYSKYESIERQEKVLVVLELLLRKNKISEEEKLRIKTSSNYPLYVVSYLVNSHK